MKKIVTLGPQGSYSDIAAKRILAASQMQDYEIDYVSSKEKIIPSIYEKNVSGVVFPIQNIILGDIGLHYLDDVILAILNSSKNLQIQGSINIPLDFALCGNLNSSVMYAHPVAAGQCKYFIEKRGYTLINSDSNPQAVLDAIANDALGIGDFEYITNKGIKVLERHIQKVENNQTRFLYLGEDISSSVLATSSYVYFIPLENKPAQLSHLLSGIAEKGVNVEELIVRRRDCSNPRLDTGNVLMITDMPIYALEGFAYKKIGMMGLDWD